MSKTVTIGILALQGAFIEHKHLLSQAFNASYAADDTLAWRSIEVRTTAELALCDGLIIPGGESTAIALVAERSGLLEGLRDFVKVHRKPTWGTCAGLILLSEAANRTKKGGQELIGGLDVRVNRNHFGRQVESFEADLQLDFLGSPGCISRVAPFKGIFIRAPIVEKLLRSIEGPQKEDDANSNTVVAPSRKSKIGAAASKVNIPVDILAVLPGRAAKLQNSSDEIDTEAADIVAVRQGNVFGTSFHPELTNDPRIHIWWLGEVRNAVITGQ